MRMNDELKKKRGRLKKVETPKISSPPTPVPIPVSSESSKVEATMATKNEPVEASSTVQIHTAVMLPTASLEPNSWNVNEMSQETLSHLARTIQKNGFDEPLQVIKRENKYVIVGGAHRYKVAILLGLKELPCVVYPWDDQRAMEECIKRNFIRGNPNYQKLGSVFAEYLKGKANFDWKQVCEAFAVKETDILKAIKDNDNLKGMAQALKSADDTKPAEPKEGEEAISKEGDVWSIGKHRIMVGDAMSESDLAVLMGDRKACVINTLLPKGTAVKDLLVNCLHFALPNAAWYIWCDGFKNLIEVICAMEIGEIKPLQHVIWKKIPSSKGKVYSTAHEAAVFAVNPAGPPPKREEPIYYNPEHEEAVFGCKTSQKPDMRIDKGTMTTVWDVPYTGSDRPTRIYEIPMLYHANPEGVCLEPFAGRGTQLMAGERVGRAVFALEKNPNLVDYCIKRLLKYNKNLEVKCSRPEAAELLLEKIGEAQ
jgi:hypothetical protein